MIQRKDLKTLVKKEILAYIAKMDLERDNKLPSEDNLASMMGVSRVTIRAVLNELASDGIVFRRQGKGTFVNPSSQSIKVSFNPVMHFSDMISSSGYTPSVEFLEASLSKADAEVANALQLAPGSEVILSKLLFQADKKFCAYCVDYFDSSLITFQQFQELRQYNHSTFEFLYEKFKIRIEWDKVEIATTDTLHTPQLQTYIPLHKGDVKSLLLLKGINYDSNDRPVMYAKEYIDTTLIQYSQIRRRSVQY